MAYFPSENRLGLKPFNSVDTATAWPFGTIVAGNDYASGKGAGEFIYLPGVAGTKAGSMVFYDTNSNTTTLTTATTANTGKPIVVAMAAITAAQFGWYQTAGNATVLKAAVKIAKGGKIFLSATTGRITGAAASGKQILNVLAISSANSTVSTLQVEFDRGFAQGQTI